MHTGFDLDTRDFVRVRTDFVRIAGDMRVPADRDCRRTDKDFDTREGRDFGYKGYCIPEAVCPWDFAWADTDFDTWDFASDKPELVRAFRALRSFPPLRAVRFR